MERAPTARSDKPCYCLARLRLSKRCPSLPGVREAVALCKAQAISGLCLGIAAAYAGKSVTHMFELRDSFDALLLRKIARLESKTLHPQVHLDCAAKFKVLIPLTCAALEDLVNGF